MTRDFHHPASVVDPVAVGSAGLLADSAPPLIQAAHLFGVGREVLIRHAGHDYRLRITRQNKLILTK